MVGSIVGALNLALGLKDLRVECECALPARFSIRLVVARDPMLSLTKPLDLIRM